MNVGEFFAHYPPRDSIDIQVSSYRAKEFNDYKLDAQLEDLKMIGEDFYYHQTSNQRLALAGDIMANISAAGTGKTYSLLKAAEVYRAEKETHYIQRCIVLTGLTQASDFKEQLINLPGSGYMNTSILSAKSETGRQKAIAHTIKDFYTISTYGTFLSMLERKYPVFAEDHKKTQESNRRLIKDYSGTNFIFDEVHFLRVDETSHQPKRVEGTNVYVPILRVREYAQLWRLVHLANRSKFNFVTATPVVNTGTEINYYTNLMLPLHRQAQGTLMKSIIELSGIDPNLIKFQLTEEEYMEERDRGENMEGVDYTPNWITRNPTDFEDYVAYFDRIMRGIISYVGEQKDDIPLTYVPTVPRLNKADFTPYRGQDELFESTMKMRGLLLEKKEHGTYREVDKYRYVSMEGVQLEAYKKYEYFDRVDIATDPDDPDAPSRSFLLDIKNIMLFTYPDGTYGNTGFNKWIIIIEEQKKVADKIKSTEIVQINDEVTFQGRGLKNWIQEDLRQLSAEYHYSVERAYKVRGKRYIPLTEIHGSGAYIYGFCMENAEFYDPDGNPYKQYIRYRGIDEENILIDNDNLTSNTKSIARDSKYPRYALFHGKLSAKEKSAILHLWNHPLNWDGDYLKVLVVSKVGQTGINLKETIHADIIDKPWGPANKYQQERRILRIGSFQQSRRKISDLEVGVNMLTVAPYETDRDGNPIPTFGMLLYNRVEEKGMRNAEIIRAMKAVAIDANLNIGRNTAPESLAYTNETDYGPAKPYILDPIPKGKRFVTLSTYNLLYAESSLDWLKKKIQDFFQSHSAASLNLLMDKIRGSYNATHMIMALKSIIDDRLRFTDMYGFNCFLREEKGYFFVTRSSPMSDRFSDVTCYHYNSNLLGITTRTFMQSISGTFSEKTSRVMEFAASQDDYDGALDSISVSLHVLDFINYIETVISTNKEALVEKLTYILDPVNNVKSKESFGPSKSSFDAIFRKYFNVLLFAESTPTKHIEAVSEQILAGNKAGVTSLGRAIDENYIMIDDGSDLTVKDITLVHYFKSLIPPRIYSGVSRKQIIGKEPVRIFRYTEHDSWTDPQDVEVLSYSLIVRRYMFNEQERMAELFPDWYGAHYRADNMYHIVNNMTASEKNRDNRGKKADTLLLIEVCWLMYYAGVTTASNYTDNILDVDDQRDAIIKTLYRRATAGEVIAFGYYSVEKTTPPRTLSDDCIRYIYPLIVGESEDRVPTVDVLVRILARHLFACGRMFVQDKNIHKSMRLLAY